MRGSRAKTGVLRLCFAYNRTRPGELSSRVGFVPVDDRYINNLGLNSIGRNSKNTQNPGSRYKTGTVNCGWEAHPRVGYPRRSSLALTVSPVIVRTLPM